MVWVFLMWDIIHYNAAIGRFLVHRYVLVFIKYIVSVPLMRPPMPCDKLPISFSKYHVHRSRISLLVFLFKFWYSIASHASSSIISSAYSGELGCAVVSISIASSKIFRRLFSASVDTWCFGAACISNSAASDFAL